jgi:hypothetical protein
VAVRSGGNADDQMRDLAGIPFDAVDELQHDDAVARTSPLSSPSPWGMATPAPR